MIKTRIAVLSTCLMVIAGGAFAQDNAKKAEEMRRSSEMMKPQGNNPPAGAMSHGTSKPMTAEEMKAEEARRKSEQMKPQ